MSRNAPPEKKGELTWDDYRLLADYRHLLRQFFAFSEVAAKEAGITAQKHRALLAIKVFDGRPTVSDLAGRLVIRHNSAVELIDRLVRAGLIRRNRDPVDHRRATLDLTALGEKKLAAISTANRGEIRRLAPLLKVLLAQLEK